LLLLLRLLALRRLTLCLLPGLLSLLPILVSIYVYVVSFVVSVRENIRATHKTCIFVCTWLGCC